MSSKQESCSLCKECEIEELKRRIDALEKLALDRYSKVPVEKLISSIRYVEKSQSMPEIPRQTPGDAG